MNNLEKLKEMTKNELIDFFYHILHCDSCFLNRDCNGKCGVEIEKWLESDREKTKSRCRWLYSELPLPLSDSTRIAYRCSNCLLHNDCKTKFCPNCGSEMECD